MGGWDLVSLGNHAVELRMGRLCSHLAEDDSPLRVTALALGERAVVRTDTLKESVATNVGQTVDLQTVQMRMVDRPPPKPAYEEGARARLSERLSVSHLVVAVGEAEEPWNQVVTADALLTAADPETILYLDLTRSSAELEQFIVANPDWRPALSVPRSISVVTGACTDASEDPLLIGVPEVLIAAIEHPGVIGIDYADIRAAFGGGPWVAAFGYSSARGADRSAQAAYTALESLQPELEIDRAVSAALVAVVQPKDGDIKEVEHSLSIVANRLPGDARSVVAAPIGPEACTEVAILVVRPVQNQNC